MKRLCILLATVTLLTFCSTASALYSLSETGEWPKTWPEELEPLRKQARTLVGPQVENEHYAIRFTKKEEFEAAWEHLLKVKSKGAPIILVRGANFFLGDDAKAGIVVHCPPRGQAVDPQSPAKPINTENVHLRWMNANYIELVVDGDIVDLNRIALPTDTPIVDQRFQETEKTKK